MRLLRFIYIIWVLARYRIDNIILTVPWLWPLRFLSLLNPFTYIRTTCLTRGVRLRLALERLGVIFIKFGQFLSTRSDLLPTDIIDELVRLQDHAPAFRVDKVYQLIEARFHNKVAQIFAYFEPVPLASASIAQVHLAKLKTGEDVVVKVLRPKIKQQIRRDIKLLKTLARLVESIMVNAHYIHPVSIVERFERGLLSEVNLAQEAANAGQFRHYFANSQLLYIPKVYSDYCFDDILVLEYVNAKPITGLKERLDDSKTIDLTKLGQQMIEVFFCQVFKHNFFHADLHPGNILVRLDRDVQLTFVDFGIIGSLSERDKHYIAENLLAFFNRDYERVAKLHRECGWLPIDVKLGEFQAAIRAISEPLFSQPLKNISVGLLLYKLVQLARSFHINIQPQLLLLQKNLLYVEVLSRQLDPELDLWQTAKPHLEQWMRNRMNVRSIFVKIVKQFPYRLDKISEVSDLFYTVLNQSHQYLSTQVAVKALQSEKHTKGHGLGGKVIKIVALLFALVAINFALAPKALSAWLLLLLGISIVIFYLI